jgi:LPS-assembly lipoprotein
MWSFKGLILSFFILLGGCGFRPLYQSSGSQKFLKHDIWVDTIPEKEGQHLRTTLMQMMGQSLEGETSSPPRYILKMKIDKQVTNIGYLQTDTTTFAQYSLTIHYSLLEKENYKTVLEGALSPLTSYGQGVSPIANLRSVEDANHRLINEAAHDIIHQLAAYFQKNP